jgi:hypothetical protein
MKNIESLERLFILLDFTFLLLIMHVSGIIVAQCLRGTSYFYNCVLFYSEV